jgi:hypothetical protein
MKNNRRALTYKGGDSTIISHTTATAIKGLTNSLTNKEAQEAKAETVKPLTVLTTRRALTTRSAGDISLESLAHIIRNGSDIEKQGIDPNNPPKDITYEMLFKGIGKEEYQGKVPYNASTDKEKEELRIKWWGIWYQIINGYSSYGKVSKVSKLPISYKKLQKTSGSVGGTIRRVISIKTAKELEAERSAAELVAADKLKAKLAEIKVSDEIDTFLLEAEYLEKTENDIDTLKRLKKAIQALERVEEALKALERLEKKAPKEIKGLIRNSQIQYPSEGFASLYQPKKGLYIYGMQLPHQFDREKLFGTMLYLLSKKKIFNLVDLHDCDGGTNGIHKEIGEGIGCNPYDRKAELEMWNKAVTSLISQDSDVKVEEKEEYETHTHFYGINEYVDMTPGTPAAWESISKIEDITKKENSVVVHCLGGAGRTGSVILYLLLRDARDVFGEMEIKRRLGLPHFGYKSINEFIQVCKSRLDNQEGIEDIEYMKDEIFGVSEIAYASRFRQRLNRIFFFLAERFQVTVFYTYGRPKTKPVVLPHDEFANQVLRDIPPNGNENPWIGFDKTGVMDWFN